MDVNKEDGERDNEERERSGKTEWRVRQYRYR